MNPFLKFRLNKKYIAKKIGKNINKNAGDEKTILFSVEIIF